MQVYLVGGAVRDALLGIKVEDKDWVVVGATSAQMLDLGYIQVGSDFPVFLHPKTKQEYALARTERKQGKGYTGFSCDSSAKVTLEEDLLRRDLTINAMAQDEAGNLIDPYGGQQDLADKMLRHVSPAFVEDPLRVLRVARFAARFHSFGFSIAAETLSLMTEIAHSGELQTLSGERVWKETARALASDNPQVYFETLRACGALLQLMPELDRLWGVPNPAKWHPEIDTGVHTMMVVQQAAMKTNKLNVRFAALLHDLGKGLTPAEHWPSHRGHETLGLEAIKAYCARLKVPNEYRELALIVSEFHSHIHRALELKPSTLLKVFNHADAWRKPERFSDFLLTCCADANGRKDFEHAAYPQAEYVRKALDAALSVDVQQIIAQGFTGAAIKQQLDKQRITAITNVKQQFTD